jgi:hypothetical protein
MSTLSTPIPNNPELMDPDNKEGDLPEPRKALNDPSSPRDVKEEGNHRGQEAVKEEVVDEVSFQTTDNEADHKTSNEVLPLFSEHHLDPGRDYVYELIFSLID